MAHWLVRLTELRCCACWGMRVLRALQFSCGMSLQYELRCSFASNRESVVHSNVRGSYTWLQRWHGPYCNEAGIDWTSWVRA